MTTKQPPRTKSNNQQPANHANLDPKTIDKLVDIEGKKLDVSLKQLQVQDSDRKNNFQLAQQGIEAQLKDRNHQRELIKHHKKYNTFMALALSLVISAFIVVLVYMSAKDVALEIIKMVATFVGGGGIGYAVAKSKYEIKTDTKE